MKKFMLISVALFAVIGCYDDSKIREPINEQGRPNMGLSVPCLAWGEDIDVVKDYMSDFELDYSDKMTLVYSGVKSEHLIAYEFEDDKLVAAAMFVDEDVSDIDEILTLLDGYDVLHEYDGTYGEYASSESNTYAEVCKSEKSGEIYWFIGWSEYIVDMDSNTITYLSSDNKAISVNTFDGFGSDLVANQFDKSTNIGTLVFSGPVTSIPDGAFSGASTLKSINLPEGIRKIGMKAFANTGLTSIKIPGSIKSIGSGAFIGCSSLTRVLASDLESWCNINFNWLESNPLYFADELYIDDELVTDLVIPDNISVIKDHTFIGAKCLRTLIVPDSVTCIGNYAFCACSGLTSITIPDSVDSIGDSAFHDCSSLTSITIPDSVVSIGRYAFIYCYNVSDVRIGTGIKNIGNGAFAGCCKYSGCIYIKAVDPPTIEHDICNPEIIIYVPHSSVSQYKSSWSYHADWIKGYDF